MKTVVNFVCTMSVINVSSMSYLMITPPKFNSSPLKNNGFFQDYFPLGMAYFQGLSQTSRGCHVFGLRELDVGAFVDIFASLLSHLGMIVNMYSKLSFYTLSEKYIHKLKRNNGYS